MAEFIRKETSLLVTAQDFAARNLEVVAEKFEKLQNQITLMPNIVRLKVYNSKGGAGPRPSGDQKRKGGKG